ncbi:MAG: hydroxyacid dehydrogenase [Polaromonas sp. 39-63-203]|jgi:phosphoglycerate dehydrogenase-like enzyme|uniref:D-2-hydroxyacid dehydrogenase n=1 Tax=Polaromonas sp. TaxID=1869339 RepID=UPI000BDBEA40|nr:D-2-hydroxyacid dehydrogenase [Polaromonas sp.]OYZ84106.1 MAG: hydroxyacid dehydrogenase [Polaromonas sp. 24-62-144]OZA98812.1 MAG: hydroxyacid dehydrogenase [Polaromonas sp. 39-63-203]HQS30319.1 D-2-hydroxyacid dehydrogenase [Polaromonas sp.]HQS89682.1 D-2-hydroxyacid dehydrogenase [Polaromonas sp.]
MPAPLRILLSDAARACLGPRIAHALGPRPFELLSINALATSPTADAITDADIAFISRDVTGRSTKHELAPALQACYDTLRQAPSLRWVHIHSAGADRPVYGELHARGVAVTTSSGTNAQVVAQTAIAGLLALARRFPQLMAAQRSHTWAPLIDSHGVALTHDLDGQTAVVVGWGPIGQHIGRLLTALGLRTVVVRRSALAVEGVDQVVGFEAMDEVLPKADWLIVACPLTDTTRGLIDRQALARLPPGAQLINVSRGEVVNEPDLIAALQCGQLAGAFLDVFAHEPLAAESPLWDMPHVIVTPHTAGHSDGHFERVAQAFVDNLPRWLAGQQLANRIR